jgi:hypothetical protein
MAIILCAGRCVPTVELNTVCTVRRFPIDDTSATESHLNCLSREFIGEQ